MMRWDDKTLCQIWFGVLNDKFDMSAIEHEKENKANHI